MSVTGTSTFVKRFDTEEREERVERYDRGYLFCDGVTHWVREYCRRIAANAPYRDIRSEGGADRRGRVRRGMPLQAHA